MCIRWMPAASRDLQSIESHIADNNPAAADRVADAIYAAVTLLIDHPHRGRPGKLVGTRELVLPQMPYVIVSVVKEGLIDVLRILHGARSWPELFD